MLPEMAGLDLEESVLTTEDAFNALKTSFKLTLGEPRKVWAIDTSARALSEPQVKEGIVLSALLYNCIGVTADTPAIPEERMMIQAVRSDGHESRWIVNHTGVISFNADVLDEAENGSAEQRINHYYPYGGWRDADNAIDQDEFRDQIFHLVNLVRNP